MISTFQQLFTAAIWTSYAFAGVFWCGSGGISNDGSYCNATVN
jgi:hypothetical protein